MAEAPGIRPARISDAEEIARLSIQLGYPASVEEITSRLETLLASAHHFVAVAVGQGPRLSGWAVVERRLHLESGETAELAGLVVDATARRSGVGAALVSAAEGWAVEQALAFIRVRSNIARHESHPFYTNLGYTLKKTQHTYEKPLSNASFHG